MHTATSVTPASPCQCNYQCSYMMVDASRHKLAVLLLGTQPKTFHHHADYFSLLHVVETELFNTLHHIVRHNVYAHVHNHSNRALYCYTSPSLREVFVHEQTSTQDLRHYYHTTAKVKVLDLHGLEQTQLNLNVLS